MLKWIYHRITEFLYSNGVVFMSRRKYLEKAALNCSLLELTVKNSEKEKYIYQYPAEGIVFSKDRPIQLHAMLSTYFEKTRPSVPLHVLYKSSTKRFKSAYFELIREFKENVKFIQETNFRMDLIMILDSIKSRKIFFLVDDLLFINDVDISNFTEYDTKLYVPSLRHGRNLRKCYTERKSQPLPIFNENIYSDKGMLVWRWRDGKLDWGYPTSIDGHLFSTLEINSIAKVTKFNGPNSFEGALNLFNECFHDRLGVCYSTSRIMNIPLNKVQTENSNISGNVSVIKLLSKWEEGFRIDYQKLYGFTNISAHQEVDISFLLNITTSTN